MWRLALRTLKFRRTSFVATFLAMFLGAAIVIGCGGLMETGVRMAADPQRLREAPIVVTGEQTHDSTALTERHRIDPGLVGRVAEVRGVRAAVGDVSVPATVLKDGKPVTGKADSYGHGWASARLTPYTLAAGSPPSPAARPSSTRTSPGAPARAWGPRSTSSSRAPSGGSRSAASPNSAATTTPTPPCSSPTTRHAPRRRPDRLHRRPAQCRHRHRRAGGRGAHRGRGPRRGAHR
ncbi:hypothetical protein LT493_05235 [Streptomyces tricolor]|nr:hypothetical protein [Streptomyces tricolor]